MKLNRTFLFLTLYVTTLALLAFAGYYFYADYTERSNISHQALIVNEHFQTDMAYVDLPRISLTMSPAHTDRSGNIRMDITLEVEKKYAPYVEGYRSRIADRLVHYTQTLNYDQLTKPKATVWLRPDLVRQVNDVGAPALIKDVIFREFLVM